MLPPATTPPAEEIAGGKGRELNGHRFFMPFDGQSALLSTSFAFKQGVASTSAPVRDDVSVAFYRYEQSLRLQAALANRVALDLEVSGAANVAGNVETVALVAGLADLRAGGGARLRLFTVRPLGLQATVGVSAYYTRGVLLVPANLLSTIAAQVNAEAEKEEPNFARAFERGVERGARAAFVETVGAVVAPSAALSAGGGPLGLQLSASPAVFITRTSVTEGDDTSVQLELAAQAEFDVSRLSSLVPVAITGSYSRRGQPGTEPLQTASLGIWYAGRRSFAAGVFGSYGWQPLPDVDETSTTLGGSLALQSHF
ncbi:uncharacterized protein SOCE26_052860 [Sorangium cellulosum]|uniref:Uncharacterized protein n=1 Tax=Sorangium cellulosum TaxID=56 RepID=A0A2L0EX07_SORCE|nr:hypothetical protein [Sorangium cellulosum]AUX43831.1 uncharacterized protein SOCE26_052860 [Sorangium cellulosum]